jgi:ABC-type multidrug transport system fused ATPase/permease subunit
MVEVVWAGTLALVIFFGGSMVLDGSLTIGLLYAFTRYIDRFLQPIRMLIQEYSQIQRGTVAAERIFEILDTEQEIKDAPGAFPLPPIEGRVTYDHVRFAYVEGVDILKDFTLDIEPGQKVAFVGQTGAGKSTIVSLLMRFYEVTGGSLKIDGHDIRDVTMESLRRQIGFVLQEPVLFSGTVADNIRYGRPDATDEEVRAAARGVGAAELIEHMSHGYDTIVQERGVGLSIGQRQVISFARAMLADPRILVLDEATANLDTTTEQVIQQGIKELTRGRTALIIAHRLSTIRDADRIIVLEDGRTIEEGDHDALIARRGAYYRLYSLGFEQTSGPVATAAAEGAGNGRRGEGRRRPE